MIIRGALIIEMVAAAWSGHWPMVFVALTTLFATLLPFVFERSLGVKLPLSFIAAIVVFLYATLFLGEAMDFYNRFWWWDKLLHGGSAIGFGMIGFVVVFMLFEGDRYAAPALAIALFGFCFAVMVGSVWEVIEFAADQLFGLNMQKSGLVDTMWDIIANMLGAAVGAAAGYFYLTGKNATGIAGVIRRFVLDNRRLFRKNRDG